MQWGGRKQYLTCKVSVNCSFWFVFLNVTLGHWLSFVTSNFDSLSLFFFTSHKTWWGQVKSCRAAWLGLHFKIKPNIIMEKYYYPYKDLVFINEKNNFFIHDFQPWSYIHLNWRNLRRKLWLLIIYLDWIWLNLHWSLYKLNLRL